MPRDDTRTMKRKVDSIIANIDIYRRDIRKALRKLKDNYGIDDLENINEEIAEIEEKIRITDRKKERLLKKADRLLKGVSDD